MSKSKPIDVYQAFLDALTSGAIRPGQRLGEVELAARWKVSRVPVREALIRLENEGLIERRSKVGTFVRQIDDRELQELYGLRAAIESFVIRRVAEIVTDQQLEELDGLAAAVDALAGKQHVEENVRREAEFHLRLCEISGMKHALRLLNIQQLFARSFRTALSRPASAQAPRSHRQIVATLRLRDPDRAAAVMNDHLFGGKIAGSCGTQPNAANSKSPARKVKTA